MTPLRALPLLLLLAACGGEEAKKAARNEAAPAASSSDRPPPGNPPGNPPENPPENPLEALIDAGMPEHPAQNPLEALEAPAAPPPPASPPPAPPGPSGNPLATPEASMKAQFELFAAGRCDDLRACFTERLRARVTPEAVEKARPEFARLTIDDLLGSVEYEGGGDRAIVKMRNGRTLTELVREGGRWLSDTLWFR